MSIPPKPFDGRSYDGRLLVQMLSYLPLAEIYTAMRVCRQWRHIIAEDPALRQFKFIDQVPEDTWPMREWYQMFSPHEAMFGWRTRFVEQLCQRPFVVNPVVHRMWTLCSPSATRSGGSRDRERSGSGTVALEVTPFEISRRTIHPDEHSAAYQLPLEDSLDAEDSQFVRYADYMAVGGPRPPSADEIRLRNRLRDRHGWKTAREYGNGTQPNARLKDIKDRDFVDPVQIYTVPAGMLCEQDDIGRDIFPVESWTWMLLTQPPVNMIALKHPTMPVAWRLQAQDGVRIIHVLQTLRKMLGPLPRQERDNCLDKGGWRIQILIGLKGARLNQVANNHDEQIWRPLTARLHIAFNDFDWEEDA